MYNKFAVSIPVYWLTIPSATNRHQHMINQFFQYGINSHTLINGYDANDVRKLIFTATGLSNIDNRSLSITLSHLNIIKKFYYETTHDMALIFEDDINFSISDYWQFTLTDVISRLPNNWNIVQLCLIRDEDLVDVRFRKMRDSDWSVAAYLISRKYAAKIINQYVQVDNIYNIDSVINNYKLVPCIEAVLFCLDFANIYTFPIFTENLNILSTYFNDNILQSNQTLNVKSGKEIDLWWRTVGLTKDLNYFFQQFK